MNSNEIEIPVPWGIIAAKTWGNSTDPLILCAHGFTDNANSFDPIIPYLPKCYYYACIDLPGHGKSAPLNSLIIRKLDYVIIFKLVYNFFKREKITIIAHSLSGLTAILFAQSYSHCVEKIIIFDMIYYFLATPSNMLGFVFEAYNKRIKFLEKENKIEPSFTKEEIIKRIMFFRLSELSRRSAEVLVERKIEPIGNGKYRIKVAPDAKQMMFDYFTLDGAVEIIRNFPIKCPHLLIQASGSNFMMLAYKKLLNEYKKNPNFELHILEGTHDIHLEKPKTVAAVVNKFLLKHQSKL